MADQARRVFAIPVALAEGVDARDRQQGSGGGRGAEPGRRRTAGRPLLRERSATRPAAEDHLG